MVARLSKENKGLFCTIIRKSMTHNYNMANGFKSYFLNFKNNNHDSIKMLHQDKKYNPTVKSQLIKTFYLPLSKTKDILGLYFSKRT